MRLENNTVLITGGTSGIDYALATSFLEQGNTVIVCGRRELTSSVIGRFDGLNVLINNAGIQRDVNFNMGMQDLEDGPCEISTNIEAPVYCATKAFIHNFTLSLRFQLQHAGISVYEVLPPRVRTELNQEGRRKSGYADSGVDVEEYVRTVLNGLARDVLEIEYPGAMSVVSSSRADLDRMFASINDQTFVW